MALDLRPLTLAELLDRSFSTYKRHVWLFAGIMGVPGAFALAYAVLMQFLQFWIGPVKPGMAPDAVMWKALPIVGAAFVFIILYTVIYAFAVGAITIAVARIYNDQPIDVAETYRLVRPHGWRLVLLTIWTSIRAFLPGIGVIVVAGVLSIILGVLLTPVLSFLIMFAAMGVAFVLMVYFIVRYGVALPAAVLENLSPNRALARSVELTKDYRGRIFLIILCAMIVTYATAALLQGPFMLAAMVAGPESVTALLLNVIGAILGTAGSLFSGPIMMIGLVMGYYDLRVRKEALDLQMMLASLDAPRA